MTNEMPFGSHPENERILLSPEQDIEIELLGLRDRLRKLIGDSERAIQAIGAEMVAAANVAGAVGERNLKGLGEAEEIAVKHKEAEARLNDLTHTKTILERALASLDEASHSSKESS